VNLLVGKNATGKTRTLSVIKGLADLLSGESRLRFRSGNFNATFDDDGKSENYVLTYSDSKVIREEFTFDGNRVLTRGDGGAGKIFAEKEEKEIEFQTPENELAAVARRDKLQHSFFEPLHQWASSLYHYAFALDLGKAAFVVVTKNHGSQVNSRDTEQVVAIFRKGEKDLGDPFKEAIRKDMAAVGYSLDDVGTGPCVSVIIEGPFPSEPVAIFVKETSLRSNTDQTEMSQGMFRALSLIIQTTYSEMAGQPSCILIDDIGEGLDFERSCALIKLLTDKAKRSSVQLVMATNDRFVMNNVPLEAWSLLRREGTECRVYNYANSKAIFDEFKFTGMNNFDFFALDFVREEQPVNE
ncbi:hypothetical protein LCGC14_2859100, partial [marine sediment metagenome]